MAGLNDDVDEGLEDIDITDEPNTNPNQPEPEKVILTTTDNPKEADREPTAQELFGVGVVDGELPNLNAEFEIIVQKNDSLKDAEEVSLGIQKSNTVSQEDIKLVDSILPGFINEDRLLGFYTKDRTKTMFKETINGLTLQLSKENEEVLFELTNYLNNLLNKYRVFTDSFENNYSDILTKQIIYIKNILENKVIYYNNDSRNLILDNCNLNDILNTSFSSINIIEVTNNQELINILDSLKIAFKDSFLMSYLTSSKSKVSGTIQSYNDDLSLNNLIELFSKTITPGLVNEISLLLKNNIEFLISVIDSNNENSLTSDNKLKMSIVIDDFNKMNRLVKSLIDFNNAFIDLLNLFKN